MPLFKITRDGDIILEKEVVRLCPILSRLEDNELKYIICAYDYIDSPWHRKPEEERKIIANRLFLKDSEKKEKDPDFRKAVEEYESCIFDIKKYTAETLKNRIYKFDQMLMSSDDPAKMKNYDSAIAILQKRYDDINEEVKAEEEMLEIKGGKKLSLIEVLKRNKKLFTDYKKEIEKEN